WNGAVIAGTMGCVAVGVGNGGGRAAAGTGAAEGGADFGATRETPDATWDGAVIAAMTGRVAGEGNAGHRNTGMVTPPSAGGLRPPGWSASRRIPASGRGEDLGLRGGERGRQTAA